MLERLSWAAIKPFVLRMLPGALAMLILVGTVWWIDRTGYQRAMAARDAVDAKMLMQIRSDQRRSEERVASVIDGLSGTYLGQHDALAATAARLQPIIIGESKNAPRLSNPAAGLTPGLLAAVNRARATGACAAAPSGRIECALPTAGAGPIRVDH